MLRPVLIYGENPKVIATLRAIKGGGVRPCVCQTAAILGKDEVASSNLASSSR